MYLASNFNTYYLIITNETQDDIIAIKNNLTSNQKNPVFNRENLIFICSNTEQQQWCINCEFNNEPTNIDIIFNDFTPTKLDAPPSWAFEKHSRFLNYYSDTKIKIIHLEGLEHNWKILHLLNDNIYTMITWPCYFHKWLYEFTRNTLYTLNEFYNRKNIIFLSSNLDSILFSYEYGYNAILANQNCLLDYNIFNSIDDKIKYDMVMNCRPEMLKRPFLAEKIENLAYIKGATYGHEKYATSGHKQYDYTNLKCKYMNETLISYIIKYV